MFLTPGTYCSGQMQLKRYINEDRTVDPVTLTALYGTLNKSVCKRLGSLQVGENVIFSDFGFRYEHTRVFWAFQMYTSLCRWSYCTSQRRISDRLLVQHSPVEGSDGEVLTSRWWLLLAVC